jgi:uncharacterized protein involved in exopolysaccharide biosynthesis
MITTIFQGRLFSNSLRRRVLFGILLLVFGLLALFPQKYRAAVTMTPTDQSSLGLSGALGQLGAINSVFGNQAAIELALKVSRSMEVRQIVIRRLDLVKKEGFSDTIETDRWLESAVTIRSLRGGILQIEASRSDGEFAKTIVSAFADATRQILGEISRRQTSYKREILTQLVGEANSRFFDAQSAYDVFRLRNQSSQPSLRLSEVGLRVEALRGTLREKEVELNAARQFATDDNLKVRQILAAMQAIQTQLAQAESASPQVNNSVGRVVVQSSQLAKLERELITARSLRDSYARFLEGAAVEDLTSSANVRIIERPFIDSARQYNSIPLALAILILVFALAAEFYVWRPPVGNQKMVRE